MLINLPAIKEVKTENGNKQQPYLIIFELSEISYESSN